MRVVCGVRLTLPLPLNVYLSVQYFCDAKATNDYISNVDESQTCVYVISVKTPRLCHHPYLKPLRVNTPQPITCNPLLTAEEYNEYEHMLAVEEEKSKYS